jgi:hypothetical protein
LEFLGDPHIKKEFEKLFFSLTPLSVCFIFVFKCWFERGVARFWLADKNHLPMSPQTRNKTSGIWLQGGGGQVSKLKEDTIIRTEKS